MNFIGLLRGFSKFKFSYKVLQNQHGQIELIKFYDYVSYLKTFCREKLT